MELDSKLIVEIEYKNDEYVLFELLQNDILYTCFLLAICYQTKLAEYELNSERNIDANLLQYSAQIPGKEKNLIIIQKIFLRIFNIFN